MFSLRGCKDGCPSAYGREPLNANVQLQAGDREKFVVINEALGERHEIALTC